MGVGEGGGGGGGRNDHVHHFMINLQKSYVAELEFELVTPGSAVRCAIDCAICMAFYMQMYFLADTDI